MGSPEIIEGEAVEVFEPRAVMVVQQPGQSLVAHATDGGPADMVKVATGLANVLKDIVEQRKLYAVIQGKKYPQVEAWMTIARLDNVVARESHAPIAHDDGSYEAFAELIRLSDGMVIGSASALCGTPDDKPWNARPLPARRSMAQTRATSRAFRQQYSWIMALAGYEPTPAEEMPRDDHPTPPAPAAATVRGEVIAQTDGPWEGKVTAGRAPVDLNLRDGADGPSFGFSLIEEIPGKNFPRKSQVLASGDFAHALSIAYAASPADLATVWGSIVMVPWDKDGKAMPPYRRIIPTRVMTPDWTLPATDAVAPVSVAPGAPSDLDGLDW